PSSQVEQPGVIVRTQHYVRVEPHAKTVLSNTRQPETVVRMTGGPSKQMDTPANPNARPKVMPPIRPLNPFRSSDNHTPIQGSFLHTQTDQRTLTGHASNDYEGSRWGHVKKGAAG